MSLPPFPGSSSNPGSRSASGYDKPPRVSPSLLDENRMDLQYPTADARYASHHRPDHLPSLQPVTSASQMSLLSGSNATTPRQSAFSREQVDRPPQLTLAMPPNLYASSSTSSMQQNPMRFSYFENADGGEAVGGAHSEARSMQMGSGAPAPWQHSSLSSSNSLHRSSYGSLAPSQGGYGASDASMGYTSSQFAYESSSSENNSPNRAHGYYDVAGSQMGYGSSSGYGMTYGTSGSKPLLAHGYASMHQVDISNNDIDSMLGQISTLYKTANTKKNAEFYRDKWARVWLSCNYTLKPSIQISIPRTILHESYRRACESFGLEPLQAASFGKVLRGQFPDVAQRRLGGRGKTRFHYCGFGTANDREAINVKQLLDDEKAGRLQLSAGMSAEFMSESRSRSHTEGDDDMAKSFRGDYLQMDQGEKHMSFVAPGHLQTNSVSSSGGAHESTEDRVAASAFATLNSAVAEQPATNMASSSATTGHMPRRHTVSFPSRDATGAEASGMTPNFTGNAPAGMSSSTDNAPYNPAGHGEGYSNLPSQSNSPTSSMHGSIHGSRLHSTVLHRRSCKDLPDWPSIDDSDSTLSAASTNLSPNGKNAWREYEAMCQDLLHAIYYGPDVASFDRRSTSFWSSLSQVSQEAMRTEPTLCDLILRGDSIIFRQLLARLDDLIGDDISDDRISTIQGTAMNMTSRVQNLLEGRLPPAFVKAKVQASEKVTEGLERVARIYETIKQFRDHAMLDMSDTSSRWYVPDSSSNSAVNRSSNASSLAAGGGSGGSYSGPSSSTGHQQGPSYPTQKPTFPFQASHLAHFQGRKRDDSISSSISDSHYTWLSGEQNYSSSASESEFSMHSAPNPDGHGGTLGSMQAPISRKWSSGARLRMSSGPWPLSRSSGASDVKGGAVGNSFGGLALTSHHQTPSDSPRPGHGADASASFGSSSGAGVAKTEGSSLGFFIQSPDSSTEQGQGMDQDHTMGTL